MKVAKQTTKFQCYCCDGTGINNKLNSILAGLAIKISMTKTKNNRPLSSAQKRKMILTIAKKFPDWKCPACNGTGKYKENHYIHIITTKDGKKVAIDGDTVK